MNEVPIYAILGNLTIDSVWVGLKWMYLLAMGIYGVFALLVIRQTQLMTKALNGNLDLPIKLVAWVHFGLAVGVWLVALVAL